MKKILSFFAAMLVAVAVFADTDFAAPGYACAADDAVLTGGSGNLTLNTELDPHQIQWSDVGLSSNALATWTITATRGCYVTASLDLGPVIASNKHIFEVKILDDKSNVKGTLAEPAENADADQVKVLDGTILIPQAGTYTVELRNNRDWGKGRIKNVILTYAADAPSEIVDVTAVELNKTELTLDLEEVELLIATVSPEDATDPSVTWETSAAEVVTVNEKGLVTAIAEGNATITAKAGEKSATCAVTVAAAAVPDVDFAEPYVLAGKVAHLEGAIWKNEDYKLYGEGGHNKNYGSALWTINVTKPCIVTGVLNGVEGGHLFELDLYKGDELLATIAHPEDKKWSAGEIALEGTLTFATEGNYTLKLRNTQEWSSGKVAGITLTFDSDYQEEVAGCDWDNIDWLGDGSAEQTFGSQFKVCVGDPAPGIVNIQKPGFAAESGIYLTFGSDLFTQISLSEGKYAVQGAGIVFYVSAFVDKETDVTVVSGGNTYEFTVYNDKGLDPTTAVSNTTVAEKTVKMIENGQLIIIRNGEKFNAQGQVIR